MTEGAHPIAPSPFPRGRRRPGTVGAAAGRGIAIRGAGRRAVAQDLDGDVRIRHSTASPGDRDYPGANAPSFVDRGGGRATWGVWTTTAT